MEFKEKHPKLYRAKEDLFVIKKGVTPDADLFLSEKNKDIYYKLKETNHIKLEFEIGTKKKTIKNGYEAYHKGENFIIDDCGLFKIPKGSKFYINEDEIITTDIIYVCKLKNVINYSQFFDIIITDGLFSNEEEFIPKDNSGSTTPILPFDTIRMPFDTTSKANYNFPIITSKNKYNFSFKNILIEQMI